MSDQKADGIATASSGTPASDISTLVSNSANAAVDSTNDSRSKAVHASGETTNNSSGGGALESIGEQLNDDGREGEAPAGSDGNSGASGGGENNTAGAAAHGDYLDNDREVDEEEEQDVTELDTVAANDVKNIILQVLSPYFDDDAGGATSVVTGVDGLGTGGNAGSSLPGSPNTANKDGSNMPTSASSPSTPHGREEDAGEDVAQRYDHAKAEVWIARICDGIMERLVGLGKPFKFVVHTMVMRKCGAGLHVCSSCYYAPSDGWLSHSHDLSAHLYAVVTVYWCAM